MQIARGGKLSRISLQSQKFSSEFFLFIIRCFLDRPHNRKTFSTNNKKYMQLQKFSTMNNLHYMVYLRRIYDLCLRLEWTIQRKLIVAVATYSITLTIIKHLLVEGLHAVVSQDLMVC